MKPCALLLFQWGALAERNMEYPLILNIRTNQEQGYLREVFLMCKSVGAASSPTGKNGKELNVH